MNTRQYYYLSTIANYGNLSHAAQALHVSPSALSKFLAECERTFGLTCQSTSILLITKFSSIFSGRM